MATKIIPIEKGIPIDKSQDLIRPERIRIEKEFSIHKEKVGNTQWQIYRTSDKEGENLLPVGKVKSGKNIQIPARSIITLQSN